MKELSEIRLELDALDRELIALFEKRMALSGEVAEYKRAHDLPVLDASREAHVLDSRAAMATPAHQAAVRALMKEIMSLSRAEQEQLLKEAKPEC